MRDTFYLRVRISPMRVSSGRKDTLVNFISLLAYAIVVVGLIGGAWTGVRKNPFKTPHHAIMFMSILVVVTIPCYFMTVLYLTWMINTFHLPHP
jgi:hypothetical protein